MEQLDDESGEGRGRSQHYGRGDMEMKRSYFAPKPVKPGDEIEVTIEADAEKGDGIAKIDRFVIFVHGGKKGDKVKIRIIEVKPRFAVADIVA